MINDHNLNHIKNIITSYKIKKQWNNELTIIKSIDGKEYCWPRKLTTKEKTTFIKSFYPNTNEPKKIYIESSANQNYIFYNGENWLSIVIF